MNPEQSVIFEHDPFAIQRKFMIPKWIRVFSWIFAVMGPLGALSSLVRVIFGAWGDYSLYGFNAYNTNAAFGTVVIAVWALKGLAAIGLLAEKDWAVKAAMADAIVGVVLCIGAMIFLPWVTITSTGSALYNIRFELFLLIPYWMKMWKISQQWEENAFARNNIAP